MFLKRTALAVFLAGFGKSLIYQCRLFHGVLKGFDPVHQDSAVFVLSLLSAVMRKQLKEVRSVFFFFFFLRMHSAKYRTK